MLRPAACGALVGALVWGIGLIFFSGGHGATGVLFGALGGLGGGLIAAIPHRKLGAFAGAVFTGATVLVGATWVVLRTFVEGSGPNPWIGWVRHEARSFAILSLPLLLANAVGLFILGRRIAHDPPASAVSRAIGTGAVIGSTSAAWSAYVVIFTCVPRLPPGALILLFFALGAVIGGLLAFRFSRSSRRPVAEVVVVATALGVGTRLAVFGASRPLFPAFAWLAMIPPVAGVVLLVFTTWSMEGNDRPPGPAPTRP